jgi:hypothetical protein
MKCHTRNYLRSLGTLRRARRREGRQPESQQQRGAAKAHGDQKWEDADKGILRPAAIWGQPIASDRWRDCYLEALTTSLRRIGSQVVIESLAAVSWLFSRSTSVTTAV